MLGGSGPRWPPVSAAGHVHSITVEVKLCSSASCQVKLFFSDETSHRRIVRCQRSALPILNLGKTMLFPSRQRVCMWCVSPLRLVFLWKNTGRISVYHHVPRSHYTDTVVVTLSARSFPSGCPGWPPCSCKSQGIPRASTQSFHGTFDRNSETEETHTEHPGTAEPLLGFCATVAAHRAKPRIRDSSRGISSRLSCTAFSVQYFSVVSPRLCPTR